MFYDTEAAQGSELIGEPGLAEFEAWAAKAMAWADAQDAKYADPLELASPLERAIDEMRAAINHALESDNEDGRHCLAMRRDGLRTGHFKLQPGRSVVVAEEAA